ncbi:MAG: M6 family metalloprotease domain-containing protein [Candidatus Hydrothermales bacterium]
MMNLFLLLLFLMPPHPQLKERMSKTDYEKMLEILKNAKERGVDQPDFENLEKFRLRLQKKQTDTAKIPVILAEFTDNLADSSVTHFQQLLFSVGTYPTGSLADYYLENSYGKFIITGWVSNWLMMPQPYSYYTNNNYGLGSYPRNAQGLARDAVLAADPYVDFSQFDRNNDGYVDVVFIVHAGPGAEETGNPNDIWSHAWVIPGGVNVDGKIAYRYSMMPENGRVGVFGHEYGHNLGLPDLYDTDYSSEGLGNWSMMSGGSWGNNGRTPVHFDIWCKYKLGFLTPVNVTSIINNASFDPVENLPIGYRLWTSGNSSPQYFLAEFRKKIKFDSYIPGEGLLIYHVDEYMTNNNYEWYPGLPGGLHYKVALEQADGKWDLEKKQNSGDLGDPYPGTTLNTSFDNYSTPNSKNYNNNTTYVSITGISPKASKIYADLAVIPVYNMSIDSSNIPNIGKKDSLIYPKIFVSNRGFYNQSFDLTLRIDSFSYTVYQHQLNGLSLSQGSASSYSFPAFSPKFSNGIYTFYGFITSPNEQMFRNDTIKVRFFSYQLINFINSPYNENPPTIDGYIDPNEWAFSYVLDISDYLKRAGRRNIQESYIYLFNTQDALYMGIKLSDTTDGTDYIRIIFDDNANGSFPQSPNTKEGEIKFQQSGSSFSATFTPYFTGGGQGSTRPLNLPYAISETGGERHIEIKINITPQNLGLDEELQVNSNLDTFAFFIMTRNSAENDLNSYWLQNIPLTQIKNPSLYGKVEIGGLNVNVKENRTSSAKLNFDLIYKKDGIRIIFNQPDYSPFDLKIVNITGRVVLKISSNAKEFSRDVSYKELNKGTYFAIIKGGKRELRKKFIIY